MSSSLPKPFLLSSEGLERIDLPMTVQISPQDAVNEADVERQDAQTFRQTFPEPLILGVLTGCFSLAVYLVTIAPDLTWANFSSDGGELITASVTWGIPHPPGYPLYVLAGKLFGLLPIGSIAFRYNFFSATAMAVAASFTTVTAYAVIAKEKFAWPVALSTGLAFAFSPLVWSQATVAEVYALNLAVLSVFLCLLLTERSSLITGIVLGVALTTHLTSLLMLPLGWVLTARKQKGRLVVGIALGLLPLALLPILEQLGSPVIWGDPSTPRGLWWLITAQLYRANIDYPQFGPTFLQQLSGWSALVLRQFAWIGWLFVALGIFNNRLGKLRTHWLLITATFYAGFSLIYSPNDAFLNFLPALVLFAPFLASGLNRIRYWALILPLIMLLLNIQTQNLRNEPQLRSIVNEALSSIPIDAVLLTPGDQSIFSLWYFQHVEGMRPDLILVDENLLAFMWYRDRLAVRYPDLDGLFVDDVMQFRELNSNNHPLCELTLREPEDLICWLNGDSVPLPDR